MTKKLIAFNWKMYPKKLKDVEGILLAFDGIDVDLETYEVVIAPPAVYLPLISSVFYEVKADIGLALQNCSWESEGAFTGEISAEMGRNFGIDYVIVGHSERRQYFGETDEMVNAKIKAALNAGLTAPIICVGEPLEIRKKGSAEIKKYVKKQVIGAMKGLMDDKVVTSKRLTFAYEPIWAIGTGKAATPNDAMEVIAYIKKILAETYKLEGVRVLYGGSVNGGNISEFIGNDMIDGALVGGASVDKKELKKILKTLHC